MTVDTSSKEENTGDVTTMNIGVEQNLFVKVRRCRNDQGIPTLTQIILHLH